MVNVIVDKVPIRHLLGRSEIDEHCETGAIFLRLNRLINNTLKEFRMSAYIL